MGNPLNVFGGKAKPLLTVIVRSGQIRLLVAEGTEVAWHRVVPLNPAYIEGGVVAQPGAVAASLKTALAQGPYAGISAGIAALPGYHALSAVIDIPVSREFRPEQIIPREARRLFSYRSDNSALTWWPMQQLKGGTDRYVMVVTRRAAIHSMGEVFSIAGIKLQSLDSGTLAIARAANAEEAVVVQAESDGGDVVIIKNGNVGLMRSAYWGGDIVDQESLLARVLDLVERSIAAHNEGNLAGPLSSSTPVLLAGAASEMLGGRVAEAMGCPVGEFAPPLVMDESLPVGEVAANLGLVLREVR